MTRYIIPFVFVLASTFTPGAVLAQGGEPPKPPATQPVPKLPPVERLDTNLYRIGTIRVDTARREISIAGTINPNVTTLEFIANTRGGLKAYETAITLDTDAITFNAALLLIGLDRSRSSNAPKAHFDPAVPDGDRVEIAIECPGHECSRMPAERLIYDKESKQTAPEGTWVYTGSAFLPDGRYLAQLDGTLIGFVHDPATIIEYAAGAGLRRYGSIVLNPNLDLMPGTAVTLTVKSIARPPASR